HEPTGRAGRHWHQHDLAALLADQSKLPRTGMVKICGPEDLDALVTNAPEDDKTCMTSREAGVVIVRTHPWAPPHPCGAVMCSPAWHRLPRCPLPA
ncbi:hypothetical protein ACFT4A_41765, partial [Streptomyces sp. NPDC057099]